MLPNHFIISVDATRTSGSYSYCYFCISNGNTREFDIGALRDKGSLTIRKRYDALLADENWSVFPMNRQVHFSYEYNNGLHTAQVDNTTITATDNTSFDRLEQIYSPKYNVSNIKIKAL